MSALFATFLNGLLSGIVPVLLQLLLTLFFGGTTTS
jgi:hypothetical protein